MSFRSFACGLSVVAALAVFVPSAHAQNLVRNGDFSQGLKEFFYGYEYAEPAPNALVPQSVFTITHNLRMPIVLNDQGAGVFDYFRSYQER